MPQHPKLGTVPKVRLGQTGPDSIAPALFALLERGVARESALASATRGTVVLRFDEGYAPVRIAFGDADVVVEDGGDGADVAIEGRLPDVVALTRARLVGSIPNPASRAGRAALARLADGRVRVRGDRPLGRALLRLMAIEG
jgi:hypothetical protein